MAAIRPLLFNGQLGLAGHLVTTLEFGLGNSKLDSVTANGTAGPIYAAAPVPYTGQPLAIKIDCGAGGAANYYEWISSIDTQTELKVAYAVQFPTAPSANVSFGKVNSSSAAGATVGMTTARKLRLNAANGSTIVTGALTLPTGQWIRVEADFVAGSTAIQTARVYLNVDAPEDSPDETISGPNVGGPTTFGKERIGENSGVANWVCYYTNVWTYNLYQRGPYVAPTGGNHWYVSLNGDNTIGDSWETAWTGMSKFWWAAIAPGDIIELDGGVRRCVVDLPLDENTWPYSRPGINGDGMMYTDLCTFKTSGTALNPIIMKVSDEPGHNGTAIFFGGRPNLLPVAGSLTYDPGADTADILPWGLDLRDVEYVHLLGQHRDAWMAYGFGRDKALLDGHGDYIRLNSTSNTILYQNLRIFDCGTYADGRVIPSPTGWNYGFYSDNQSIEAAGSNITESRCIIHDCGQDAFQGSGAGDHWRFEYSHHFYSRFHPIWLGYPFNAGCQAIPAQNATHVDGIQWYAGANPNISLDIDYCIMGPGVNQCIYLGDEGTVTWAPVTIHNTLILAPQSHGIQGDHAGSQPIGWDVDYVTIHGPNTPFNGYTHWFGIEMNGGSAHTVNHTIVGSGGKFYSATSFNTGACANNLVYGSGADAMPGSINLDPQFRRPLDPTNNTASWQDYADLDLTPMAAGAIGLGSPIHSMQSLYNMIDILNGDSPTPDPIPYSDSAAHFRTRFWPEGFKRKYTTGVS